MSNHRKGRPANRHSASGLSSGTTGTTSKRWQDHPLIHGQYFPILPVKLLEEVDLQLDPGYCKTSSWQLEWRLSKMASEIPQAVAFWDGRCAQEHPWLQLKPREAEPQEEGSGPLNWEEMAKAAQREQQGLPEPKKPRKPLMHDRIAGAYCGWLMACRQFLQEHDALVLQLQSVCTNHDRAVFASGPFEALTSGGLPDAFKPMHDVYWHFCARWRLDRLIGPYLPMPAQPQHMVLNSPTSFCRSLLPGELLYVPDVYGHLLVEQVTKPQGTASPPEEKHLEGWYEIVSSANQNKGQQVERHIQQFGLLHVWRALHGRHKDAMRGKLDPIRRTIANHFGMGLSTARRILSDFKALA